MDPEAVGLESIADFEASLIADDALGDAGDQAKDSSPADAKTTDALAPEKWIGKRLSHFRLMRLMGAGNMGVVFQVEDVNLKRIAALKVLRRQIKGADRAVMVDRFLLEARTAAGIDHPSIAQVYEIDEHHGWWYIAMEFLEGGSLHHLVETSGPLAPERAALMLTDATRGLVAAHEEGIIHRDIKPANLMLSRRGRCKIVDFGLVKLDSAENPFRDDDRLVLGTPMYIAPEVALGRGATAASDVYSLGATLYAVLVGRPPFRADNVRDLLRMHVKSPAPDVRERAPHVPASMATLILRAMSKDPANRPTADAFAAALQSEISGALAGDPSSGVLPAGEAARVGSGSSATGEYAPAAGSAAGSSALTSDTVRLSGGLFGSMTSRAPVGWLAALSLIVVAAVIVVGVWWQRRPAPATGAAPVALDPITNEIGMKVLPIPPGEFVLGSPPTEAGRNHDERTARVKLTHGFFMSMTEVTQQQWAAVMGDDYVPPEGVHPNEESGRRFIGRMLPAYVSWNEAAEFCRLLSQRAGAYYRLPTEAEWEYACRAGTRSAFHTGLSLDLSQANIEAATNGLDTARPARHPLPVASFPPNAWGLHDMHGNVMEWCANWKAEYPLGPLTDPTGPAEGKLRVLRGGSWDSPARVARSANRWYNPPVVRTDYIGFRVVLEPETDPPDDVASYLNAPLDPTAPAAPTTSASDPPAPPAGGVVDAALPEYEPAVVLDQRLRSVGSDTMDELMLLWERAFQQWHAQVEFRHEGRGSGTAVPALAEGLSHFGPMSRALKATELADFQSEYGYQPTQVCVAIDALAVYVHPTNPLAERGLALAELDAIYSTTRARGFPRAVRRWGDLGLGGGWASAPIHVFSRNPASGTYSVFRATVLEGGEYKATNQELVSSTVVVQAVAGDRYGIGYSGIGFKQPGVATVPLAPVEGGPCVSPLPATAYNGSYPLARPLFLTIDHPPGEGLSPLHREFLRFVYSRQGQEIVAQTGFFPLDATLAARELQRVGLKPTQPTAP